MRFYSEKARFEAMLCIARACRPTVPVAFLAETLGFAAIEQAEEGADPEASCREWLEGHGAVLALAGDGAEASVDCRASAGSLYIPEPDDAVAHGDANLAVEDFLKNI